MIKETKVTPDTRWECISCGKCCHKLGNAFNFRLFNGNSDTCVKLNEKNRCGIYTERPLGCKMYPFYPDWEKFKLGKVDFKLGSLKIDSGCSGFGKGQKIVRNERLFKKLNKVSLELKRRIVANPRGKIKELFME
ncbi:YkgJ family cysteine cluster protein [archaeon]|jgi:hypothetical protein|nr:YkgJ family cysteine cluster protein [archaeon]MBT4397461.1 YkgJ family cysteine cluster protein [archaeon]MBT4440533.1 YkgJ family cysteine cluster protein [archaeon]